MSQSKLEIPTPAPPPTREIAELEDRVDRVVVIRPARRWPHLDVSELWHFRELLARLVWRDVSVRYKQTFLGVAWALLVPVFTAAVYVVIFGKFAQFPAGEENTAYPSLVLAGVIPMQYFASSLTGSSMSLAANLQLVTKVYFPRTLLPLGAVIVPLIDFLVGLPVLIALMWYYDTWPDGANVLFAPLFILLAMVTVLGLGFLLSAVNVRYRDVRYMIPVFLQVLPLLSGVMYADRGDPDEVAVDPRLQPDDRGDRGLAVGDARRGHAQPGPDGDRRRPSGSRSSSAASPSSVPPSPASRTRSDGDRDRRAEPVEEVPHRGDAGRLRNAARVALARRPAHGRT